MQELTAVVYKSHSVHNMSSRELDELLMRARAVNEKLQVSGALLYDQGRFLQYIEGPTENVERVYSRIRRSHQHERLVELSYKPIEARQFAQWHMGFAEPPASLLKQIANEMWMQVLPDLRAGQNTSPGMQMLLDFWERSGQRPAAPSL